MTIQSSWFKASQRGLWLYVSLDHQNRLLLSETMIMVYLSLKFLGGRHCEVIKKPTISFQKLIIDIHLMDLCTWEINYYFWIDQYIGRWIWIEDLAHSCLSFIGQHGDPIIESLIIYCSSWLNLPQNCQLAIKNVK